MRSHWKLFITVLSLNLGVVVSVMAAVEVGQSAPDFSLMDTKGASHKLSDYKGKFVVLEWVNPDCPFVHKHYDSKNMQNLQAQYTGQGVVWLSINSSVEGKQGHYSSEENDRIVQEREAHPTAVLLDGAGDVGRLYGAQTTPHMFIIDPQGTLIYQGAIDNTPTPDPAAIPNSVNYVRQALDEAMSGKPVSVAATKSYGCSVKY